MTRSTVGSAVSRRANRPPRCRDTPVTRTVRATQCLARYFLLRRWTRVFLSSLRCFFFAMRLRRFLMTEPTGVPRGLLLRPSRDGRSVRSVLVSRSDGSDYPPPRRLRPAGQPASTKESARGSRRPPARGRGRSDRRGRRACPRVHEPVHGHLRHAHGRGHLGHGEEAHLRQRTLAAACRHALQSVVRPPGTRAHETPTSQGRHAAAYPASECRASGSRPCRGKTAARVARTARSTRVRRGPTRRPTARWAVDRPSVMRPRGGAAEQRRGRAGATPPGPPRVTSTGSSDRLDRRRWAQARGTTSTIS